MLCYWRDRVKDPLALLEVQAKDESPRVRLEAVRACSFFKTSKAAEVALAVLDRAPVEHGRYAEFSDPAVVPVPAFSNIYPFDSSGRPLSGVFLYDENSQPLTTPYPAGECVPRDRVPVPANRYPQPVYRVDPTGGCVPRSDVPSPSLPAAPGATSPGATGTPPSATVTPPATPEAPATPTS